MSKDTTTSGKVSAGTPVPAASAANAKAAFKNFSLSRIPAAKRTRTYVTKGEDVPARQKSLIKRQVAALTPSSPGLSLVISDQKALNMKDGKIDLTMLIDAMERARQGSQFYASGTSVLEQIDNQNQVEDFFSALKGKKNAQPK
jgi:hypothetical protein